MKEIEAADLMSALEFDLKDNSIAGRRYGVRFILLNTPLELLSCTQVLKHNNIKEIVITDIFDEETLHNDKLLTSDQVSRKISNLPERCVFLGVSQFARLLSDREFHFFFTALADYETNSSTKRIYIPLVDIQERFRRLFWDSYPRKYAERVIPLKMKKAEESSRMHCYVPSMELCEHRGMEVISSYRDWLELEEHYNWKEVVIESKLLKRKAKNIHPGGGAFKYEQIESYQELIEKRYPSFFLSHWYYKKADLLLWKRLWEEADFNVNCCDFSLGYFNVRKIDKYTWLNLFFKATDDFSKWLLLQHAASSLSDTPFLKTLAKELLKEPIDSISVSCFIRKCYNYSWLFSSLLENQVWSERKEILRACKKIGYNIDNVEIPLQETTYFSDLCDTQFDSFALAYTGILAFENKIVLEKVKSGRIEKELLFDLFREIKDYFDDSCLEEHVITPWVCSYFREYRNAKIRDTITPEVSVFLNELNGSDANFWGWYYSQCSIHEKLQEMGEGVVLWADGLGFEWAPYVLNNLKRSLRDRDIRLYATHSKLPTNTALNRIENAKKLPELDNLFHKGHYRYPDSILEELTVLDQLIKKIEELCNLHDTVYLVSDHGASALPRLTTGLNRFCATEHEGRYKRHERLLSNDDYGLTVEADGCIYYVARTHQSLSAKPSREVHGGCTPEEVIVPLLAIKKKNTVQDFAFDVQVTTPVVSTLSPSLGVIIQAPSNVRVRILCGNIEQRLYGDSKTPQIINVSRLKVGEHQLVCFYGNQQLTRNFQIKNPNIEEEDLGFD